MVRGVDREHPQLPGLEYRPSLAQLLTPVAAGIDPADYVDITDYEIADVPNLHADLINVDWKEGRSVLSHQPAARGRWVGIAVNPEDYVQVAKKPERLGGDVEVKALHSYPKNERYDLVKQATARRAGVHAVEGKLEGIDRRLAEINHQRDLLSVLAEMSAGKTFNLRRSYDARAKFHDLMRNVVAGMVDAVGIQREYGPDEMTLLRRTIDKRFYIHPEHVGPRVQYFNQFAQLGTEYLGHLVMIYAKSSYESRKYIREHSV